MKKVIVSNEMYTILKSHDVYVSCNVIFGRCGKCLLRIEAEKRGYHNCHSYLSLPSFYKGAVQIIPENGVTLHKLGKFYV